MGGTIMNTAKKLFIITMLLWITVCTEALSAAAEDLVHESPLFVSVATHFALNMRFHKSEDSEPIAFIIKPCNKIQLTIQNFEELFAKIFDKEMCPFLRAISFKNCNLSLDAYKTLLGYLARYCPRLQYIDLRGNDAISIFHEGKEKIQSTAVAGATIFYSPVHSDKMFEQVLEKAEQVDLFDPIVVDKAGETD
jgi:hypothetical protein